MLASLCLFAFLGRDRESNFVAGACSERIKIGIVVLQFCVASAGRSYGSEFKWNGSTNLTQDWGGTGFWKLKKRNLGAFIVERSRKIAFPIERCRKIDIADGNGFRDLDIVG